MTPLQSVSLVAWVAVAAVGGWLVHGNSRPASPCALKAERKLPVGFRLRDGDWSGPDGVASVSGKYANRDYERRDDICANQLDDVPRLMVPKDHYPLVLQTAAAHLNAGAKVSLAREGWMLYDVPVITVLCPNNVCNAIVVAVPDIQMEKASATPPPAVMLHTLP
jgi:hypothetical protein